jgi:hypothetical protein
VMAAQLVEVTKTRNGSHCFQGSEVCTRAVLRFSWRSRSASRSPYLGRNSSLPKRFSSDVVSGRMRFKSASTPASWLMARARRRDWE